MATEELKITISFPWYAKPLLWCMGVVATCIGPFLTDEQADRLADKWGNWFCDLVGVE